MINIALITDGFIEDYLLETRLDSLISKTIKAHPTARSPAAVRLHIQYSPDDCNLSSDVHNYMQTSSVGFQSYHSISKTTASNTVKKMMLSNCEYAILYITIPKLQEQVIAYCRKLNIKFHLG